MRYSVRTEGAPFILVDAEGTEGRLISAEPVEMTIEQLGVESLNRPRLICTPISDTGKPLVEVPAEPDGNPPTSSAEDTTQSAEVAEPMPDFEQPKTYTRPQVRRGNGKKRR